MNTDTNRSPEQIEREIAATRAEVDRTADALKDKMSPGQLMEEVMRSFQSSGGSELMHNLGARVKENPLPLAMIGAGMAWLMMDSGKKSEPDYARAAPEPRSFGEADVYAAEVDIVAMEFEVDGSGSGDASSGGLRGAKDKASSAAHAAKDKVSSVAQSTKEGLSSAASSASGAAHKAQSTVQNVVQSEPLVLGALGVALGAALGAALPSTRFEDERLGPVKDKAIGKGKEKLQDAKAVAGSALDGAKSEADRQGLGGQTGDLVDKARDVVRAGTENARRETERRMGQ